MDYEIGKISYVQCALMAQALHHDVARRLRSMNVTIDPLGAGKASMALAIVIASYAKQTGLANVRAIVSKAFELEGIPREDDDPLTCADPIGKDAEG